MSTSIVQTSVFAVLVLMLVAYVRLHWPRLNGSLILPLFFAISLGVAFLVRSSPPFRDQAVWNHLTLRHLSVGATVIVALFEAGFAAGLDSALARWGKTGVGVNVGNTDVAAPADPVAPPVPAPADILPVPNGWSAGDANAAAYIAPHDSPV